MKFRHMLLILPVVFLASACDGYFQGNENLLSEELDGTNDDLSMPAPDRSSGGDSTMITVYGCNADGSPSIWQVPESAYDVNPGLYNTEPIDCLIPGS